MTNPLGKVAASAWRRLTLANYAAVVSTVAIFLTVGSLVYTKKSYELNVTKDQRELMNSIATSNVALSERLSTQLIEIQNSRVAIGHLGQSFLQLTQLTTSSVVKNGTIDQAAVDRARRQVEAVEQDRKSVEGHSHGLPIDAFNAVRKMYLDTGSTESYLHDLDGLEKDGLWELPKAPLSPDMLQLRKDQGLGPPKPIPRLSDAMSSAFTDVIRDNLAALKALQDAEKETSARWAEVEKAIADGRK